jgi:hypothetical protein
MSIAFANGVTFTTGLTRISGWDLFDCNTSKLGFVLDLLLQSVVRPIVSILSGVRFCLLALFSALPDTIKIFESNTSIVLFSELYNLLAHDVIDMSHPPRFRLLQFLYRAILASFLQPLTLGSKTSAHMANTRKLEKHWRTFRRADDCEDILTSVNSNEPLANSCIGNFHRATNERIPNPFLRTLDLERTSFCLTSEQSIESSSMIGSMNYQRHPLASASAERERERVGFTNLVQLPILVVGFQRQAFELFRIGFGVCITDRLVDDSRVDLNSSEIFARQFPALGFIKCKNLISDFGIEPGQSLKLLNLILVQVQEGQLERQSDCCHSDIISLRNSEINEIACIYAGIIDFFKVDCAATSPAKCLSIMAGALLRNSGKNNVLSKSNFPMVTSARPKGTRLLWVVTQRSEAPERVCLERRYDRDLFSNHRCNYRHAQKEA